MLILSAYCLMIMSAEKSHRNVEALVVCIDRDDDLGRKAGVRGPVIGEDDNFKAAKALGNIGPGARHAAASLLQLLDDDDPNVRWEATAALAKIDLASIRDEDWNRLLADPDPGVRGQAAAIRAMTP